VFWILVIIVVVVFYVHKKMKEAHDSRIKIRKVCVGSFERVNLKMQIIRELESEIYGDEYYEDIEGLERELERTIGELRSKTNKIIEDIGNIGVIVDMPPDWLDDDEPEVVKHKLREKDDVQYRLWLEYVPRLKEMFDTAKSGEIEQSDVESYCVEVYSAWAKMDMYLNSRGLLAT